MSGRHREMPPELAEALALVAPGTELREGIDNIIHANNGALIVVSNPEKLKRLGIISGGMKIDCSFTPMRLYELAKMDGALVVSPDFSVIHYANVQLNPDPSLPSEETGMRHLSGHRTAQQTGDLVIVVSERRRVVSLYQGSYGPHVLEDIGVMLSKADSALATLEKFTRRLRDEARILTLHEYDGVVTLREVIGAISTFETSVRIAEEIRAYIRELGSEGRLVEMQLEQAFHDVPDQYEALLRDYVDEGVDYEEALAALHELTPEELSEPMHISQALGYGSVGQTEDFFVKPRGYRQLARVPRLPRKVAERLISEFGSLKGLLEASEDELDDVEGVGQARARAIRRGLRRQRELDRSEDIL
ncbi:MAG: DNA integrity scanning diadenylate cyclase DisA [Rubrobacteraceae bacterium]|uniref:DNA integrity scanning diadenylate cyclase DisA n=1 Tax=Rubrobacter naiadicus TaxID=1392641 RepID=UPI002362FC2B|nr:DNA integrity scanning diadenylate cyclase DisA [Rubrobacter naiadicus]MCL6437855.1 DNA integrity scanning diadenylate cyclase DisA [Rubrobacteraceae bacterium]